MSDIDFGYNVTPPAALPTAGEQANIRAAFQLGTAALAAKEDFDIAPADLAIALQGEMNTTLMALSPPLVDGSFTAGPVYISSSGGVVTISSSVSFSGGINLYRTFKIHSIADYGFAAQGNGSLVLPVGLTTIGSSAFSLCSNLTGPLILPPTVTTIGDYAFDGAGFTDFLYVPESVTSVGSSAFYCPNIPTLYAAVDASVMETSYPNSLTQIYYKPGTSGWTNPWNGIPTAEWSDYPTLPNF